MHIKKGQDVVISDAREIPYIHRKLLGRGGYAVVDEVKDRHTKAVYARKTYTARYNEDPAAVEAQFREAVRIMRAIPHRHITSVHASYILNGIGNPPSLAMILSPVASDGTLQDLLDTLREPGRQIKQAETEILQRCFGCISSALRHIHQRAVRHKDIKPNNILVDRGRLLLTDFGNAFDGSEHGATTSGPAVSFTREYCAPEVQAGRKRNAKSDLFSLGCVYVDVLGALYPNKVLRKPHGVAYAELANAIRKQLSRAEGLPQKLRIATYKLLDLESSKRPTSEELYIMLDSFDRSTSACNIFCPKGLRAQPTSSTDLGYADEGNGGDADDAASVASSEDSVAHATDMDSRKPAHRRSGSDTSFVYITEDDMPSPELYVYVS